MRNGPKRLFLMLLALFGLMSPQWFLLSGAKQISSDTEFELYYGQGSFTKHEFEGISMDVFEMQGEKTWSVVAESAVNNAQEIWVFGGVDGAYMVEPQNQIFFSGDLGLFNPQYEKIDLSGDVKASSTQGYNFKTEALEIQKEKVREDGDTKEDVFFSSEEKVDLYDDNGQFKVKAVGFKGNIQSGMVYLLSDVWSRKKDDKGAEAIIESDKAKIQSRLSTIKFYENLKVTQDKFKITGDEADFYANKETDEIESIRVRGNIFATDGIKTALSDKVDLKLKEDAIIFQGSPRIRVGENEMVGEEILITNNQKNVQVIRGNIKSTNNPLEDIEKELEKESEENEQ